MDNYGLHLYISWNFHGIWNGNDYGLVLMGKLFETIVDYPAVPPRLASDNFDRRCMSNKITTEVPTLLLRHPIRECLGHGRDGAPVPKGSEVGEHKKNKRAFGRFIIYVYMYMYMYMYMAYGRFTLW